MPEFLFETGVEEMPASWLPGLTEQMRQRFSEIAEREHLAPQSVASFSTPRRLIVTGQIMARQPDREDKVWGPAAKIARDAAGNWTKAAEGFAKKNGVAVDQLQQAPRDPAVPAELNLLHVKRTAGRDARDVLPAAIAAFLRGLAFPKRMSWDAWLEDGKGTFPFGRPIRWLVILLDGTVVPFTIFEAQTAAKGRAIVESGDTTYGHRFLPPGAAGRAVRVRSFDDLRRHLEEQRVVVDPARREEIIQSQLAPMAGTGLSDFGLLAEWKHLVEWPTVMLGRIPEEFRTLPIEVLQTVLVHHQKYIPLGEDRHVTRFAALTNADRAAEAEIVRGMERVVVARLRDAAFFFAEDMKRPLADRVKDLAGVTFHQGLGSYEEKARRLVRLIDTMGEGLGILTRGEMETAREAALVAKADLTTLMVREFPELQGVMGGIYLRAQGHPQANVAEAVRWHYHPVSIEEGSLPARVFSGGDATVFGAVSLADKLDTLAGYFGLGLVPTGSSDPYGLRRAAQGAVRVLLDFWQAGETEERPSLRKLTEAAVAGYGQALQRPAADVVRDLESFLLDRLRYVLTARGFAADEVEAVLGAREPDALDDPREAWKRLQALHRVRLDATEDFEALAVAFKRAKNIIGDRPPAEVDTGLLQEGAERDLHHAVAQLQPPTPGGGRQGRGVDGYESRLRSLSSLRGPVDRFFDDVLVMAEDPRLRANRLGLLSQALSLFYRIADISKLGG
ncbi:MAG TPA: glycine--tRNA ligase subunit beta [Vicinamibacteria bacterium]|nr:glycine--tRNA ligase subunit beta [Vicinamibacteria bacterium]